MKKFLAFIPVVALFAFFIVPSCQKEISKETGKDSLFIAAGSLKDSNNNCLKDSVHGTFYNGVTPGSDTAYLEVQVNVTTTGTYTISTDQQNGFLFTASGFFSSTGINTIQLKPVGTPILPVLTDFVLSFDTSICFVTVEVKDSTGTGLGGGGSIDSINNSDTAWQFSTDSGYFHGVVVTAVSGDTVGLTFLSIIGKTAALKDSTLLLNVFFPGNTIEPGTYLTQGIPLSQAVFGFSDERDTTIYFAVNDSSSPSLMNITITSYDSISRVVTGTFSGLANDANGDAVINISKGSFKAVVN